MKQFAILHTTKTTQILIDTDFDHVTDTYTVSVKFWAKDINGYATMSPSWAARHKKDYERFFEEMKDPRYALKFCSKVSEGLELEEARTNTEELLQFALHQFTGFYHATHGYSLTELCDSMSFTRQEWDILKIRKSVDFMDDHLKQEIEAYLDILDEQ